jgi:hypothetical protein
MTDERRPIRQISRNLKKFQAAISELTDVIGQGGHPRSGSAREPSGVVPMRSPLHSRNWNRFLNLRPLPSWVGSWRRGSRGRSSLWSDIGRPLLILLTSIREGHFAVGMKESRWKPLTVGATSRINEQTHLLSFSSIYIHVVRLRGSFQQTSEHHISASMLLTGGILNPSLRLAA